MLSHRNDDFGSVTEWTSVEFGLDLPDELFRWNGPVVEDEPDDWEAEDAGRREWLAGRGLQRLVLPMAAEVYVHDRDEDTGAFEASVHAHGSGLLERRPASDEAWPDRHHAEQHEYRWRDGSRDWRLSISDPLTDDQLDAVKTQLRNVR